MRKDLPKWPDAWTRNRIASGDYIRRRLILEHRDAVAQGELALFQPLKLDLVRRANPLQGFNRRIEITVLFTQARNFLAHFAYFCFARAVWHSGGSVRRLACHNVGRRTEARARVVNFSVRLILAD